MIQNRANTAEHTQRTNTSIRKTLPPSPQWPTYTPGIIEDTRWGRKERPDALLPNLGGQTGLDLSSELARRGVLDEYGVKVIGVNVDAIERGEDLQRGAFLCYSTKDGFRAPGTCSDSCIMLLNSRHQSHTCPLHSDALSILPHLLRVTPLGPARESYPTLFEVPVQARSRVGSRAP